MGKEQSGKESLQETDGNLQLSTITQLLQVSATLQHIDELFLWLARTFVERFKVQVVQFWLGQLVTPDACTVKLHAMVSQDTALPAHVVMNDEVNRQIRRILFEKRDVIVLPMSKLFSAYQANLLKRYGLNYCMGYRLRSGQSGEVASDDDVTEQSSAVIVAALLFFRVPPQQKLFLAIVQILKHAIKIALHRHLLDQKPVTGDSIAVVVDNPYHQRALPALHELIPQRIEDRDLLCSSNPLASSLVIADRHARHLYAAIDGRKKLGELAKDLQFDTRELAMALRLLLMERRVRLYRATGQPVDNAFLLEDH